MILNNLKKASGTIDHDLLLQKLYAIGFSKYTVNWFKSYLSNRSFLINLGNNFSQPAPVCCGVPQDSILGPLLFLIYVNDMSQAVKCDLFLYADDSCIVCQRKDINEIQKHLNEDFSNSIHFREDKIKSIVFASKFKRKNVKKLNIKYWIYKSNNILKLSI